MRTSLKKLIALMIITVIFSVQGIPTYGLTDVFYELFDSHGAIMLLIDIETGKILYANDAAAVFYGYSLEELQTMKMSQINQLSEEQIDIEMQAAAQEERNYFLFDHKLASGEIRTVEVYSYPYELQGKQILFSIIHDETDRLLLELENQKSAKRLFYFSIGIIGLLILFLIGLFYNVRALKKKNKEISNRNKEISNINKLRKTFMDADERLVYLKDQNLRYIFVNKAMEEFYGKSEQEIVGQDDFVLTESDFALLRVETDKEVLEQKRLVSSEVQYDNRTYRTKKFPIELLDGHMGIGAYIEDITRQKKDKKREEKNLLRNLILVDVFTNSFTSTTCQLEYVLEKAIELTGSKSGFIYNHSKEVSDIVVSPNDLAMDQVKQSSFWDTVLTQDHAVILHQKTPFFKKCMLVPVLEKGRVVAIIALMDKEEEYNGNDLYQVGALMNGVWIAKEKRDKEEQLQLILDSAAEAIYGVDTEGRCTFCNASCLKMLGYESQEQLVGKNMHEQIHANDGLEDVGHQGASKVCPMAKAFTLGEKVYLEDEIFYKKNGDPIEVECFAYPQYKDGKLIGAVVTFLDIGERKKAQREIQYLSYHDGLTGLYNRLFFDEEFSRMDKKELLPLSILMGDVNGLKLTNDIFGHVAGDDLLKSIAKVLTDICPGEDRICRIGGDEFVVLMPHTTLEEAKRKYRAIKETFAKVQIKAITGSISMGYATKIEIEQPLLEVFEEAEEKMYQEKTLEKSKQNKLFLESILSNLHERMPRELDHAQKVSKMCRQIAKALHYTQKEMRQVEEVGFLHDIGKIVLEDEVLQKNKGFTGEEIQEIKQHPVIGYRLLNTFDDTVDIAQSVLAHHERWDGKGYPKGLKGEEIPKLARLLAIANFYVKYSDTKTHEEALKILEKNSGSWFDPEMVKAFLSEIRTK